METICALATPPMKSALAIIRISGDDCFSIVSKIFSKSLEKIEKRTILYGYILDGEKKVDQVLMNVYVAPHSFTGENSVEILCHGSPLLAEEIIQLLLSHGARLAMNGEFSSRAFFHGKLDLIQAEAIQELIDSTSKEGSYLSMLSLEGKTSSKLLPLQEKLTGLLSNIEVNIDYPEYVDIEEVTYERIVEETIQMEKEIEALIVEGEEGRKIQEGIRVAIVGKPNVGKSSLLNALLKEEKAIVTDIAGTTRDVVEGQVVYHGLTYRFFDTAGIHESTDKVESIGIQKAKQVMDEADLVVVVLDGSTSKEQEDEEILQAIPEKKKIVVYNKTDLTSSIDGIGISAIKGEIQPFLDELYQRSGVSESSYQRPSLHNTRQIGLLKQIANRLENARKEALEQVPLDLISVSLMDAYQTFQKLLGKTGDTDFTKEIFALFCVGK